MHVDLGLQGLGILIACSLIFGAAAQALFWRSMPRWLWIVAAASYLVFGFVISEAMFANATEEDIQPIIDGLAFDESLLAIFPAALVVLLAWFATRRGLIHRPA